MAISNPGLDRYNEYATDEITGYLREQGCDRVPIARDRCESLLDSARPQIGEIVEEHTERANFFVFSLYKTEFSPQFLPFIPSYELETVGAFNRFYTYRAGSGN
jgi:hypothetical protein